MTPRSARLRLLLWLYSNANIAGCVLALAGPGLFLTGVIDRGWLAITLGLYTAGYLAAPRSPALERTIQDSLTTQETLARLDALIAAARPHLTAEMAAHLDGVRTSVIEVLPRLTGSAAHDGNAFTVRETVFRYLPETLANYVSLPPVFRRTQPLQQGRTARELLGTQLALLDTTLRDIVANVAQSDAQALLANGKFLEAKFQHPDFLAQ